ncbi:MAG TPA: hypothetical protein VFC99_17095 [Acidimicrobiia bacterium]|nr:hypothetical protein [Acidimicrobiia bacterium]
MSSEQAATVPGGPITFVVEHRAVVQNGVEAGGPTVRVLGADDGHEYLRFDLFNVGAHYHYEPPADEERILVIDTVAEGDAVSWGLTRLRERLAPMLAAAGATALAGALDRETLARALDDVESLVRTPQPATA